MSASNSTSEISFTRLNVLNDGLDFALGLMTWFYSPLFPPPQDCFFRVKFIYGTLLLGQTAYWLFQASLAYNVSSSYSKSIPGTPILIFLAFLVRVGVGIFVVSNYTWKVNANLVCSSMLNVQINLLDKVMEITYSLILSILFTYPILMGVKDINASMTMTSSYHDKNDPRIAGRKWLKRIIRDQGFILIISLLVEILYLVCVFTSSNPTLVSTWNALFTTSYVFLMMIHMIITVARRAKESSAKL
ncbi:hypothetical protein BCR33DRAFT_710957 [Rhizoclosmatium globosum]|uniref:Uncharacterized protein n=1 Tax=Rhizoclosmatium globosum TaxID=329046 RepID=A0A1Y2D2M5_9FUNG|nr:hypothetical protein BCR33DRAFT_710957 [Rhizoclosmatium globosum]|eukprot:ORY53551.1 hypothetical protein BCR33DRAFT_710957 [Rhizoclosmatium globosum]